MNGNVETEQVHEIEESIKYYVENNQDVDFNEDDTIYDDLNLEDDEGAFGMGMDIDRVSSQDAQSIQDDLPETADGRGASTGGGKPKSASVSEPPGAAARRPSNQLKSPLPALASLHTPLGNITNGATPSAMKPAPIPTRAPGETLKYASAAAAATASDKSAVGIAPLPPPPSATIPSPRATSTALNTLPLAPAAKSSATTSPSVAPSLPTSVGHTPAQQPANPASSANDNAPNPQGPPKSPVSSQTKIPPSGRPDNMAKSTPTAPSADDSALSESSRASSPPQAAVAPSPRTRPSESQPPPSTEEQLSTESRNGLASMKPDEDESVYHLPPGLQDLIQSFEATKSHASSTPSPSVQRLLGISQGTCPDYLDAEKPRHYRPQTKYNTPRYYPQEPFTMVDDPSLYSRIDTDTLFYIFYYRQNTYQQYMAAKALKSQSWRFHKQYQTWFQRHEEPKTITEEYEQGTYRFFDYESTWYAKTIPKAKR